MLCSGCRYMSLESDNHLFDYAYLLSGITAMTFIIYEYYCFYLHQAMHSSHL